MGFGDTLALRLLLGLQQIRLHGFFLLRSRQLLDPFALRRQHHEGDAINRVGTGGEDGHLVFLRTVENMEHQLCALALADPVALHFLEGVGPVELFEIVQQAFGISTHAELPLLHLFLLDRKTAAHRIAFLHLVVGQHGTQFRAPVHRGLAQISDTVLHQQVGLFLFAQAVPAPFLLQLRYQGFNGFRLVSSGIVPVIEHFQERPLRPFVVFRITGADFARPVV